MQIRELVMSYSDRYINISQDFFCIELKLCTVVILITKVHDVSTVTFLWPHNVLQALSIQRVKSEVSFFKCYLLVVHSVGASEFGHYTAQAYESPFWSNKLGTFHLRRVEAWQQLTSILLQ